MKKGFFIFLILFSISSYGNAKDSYLTVKQKSDVSTELCNGQNELGLAGFYLNPKFKTKVLEKKYSNVSEDSSGLQVILECRYTIFDLNIEFDNTKINNKTSRSENFNFFQKNAYSLLIWVESKLKSWAGTIFCMVLLIRLFLFPLNILHHNASKISDEVHKRVVQKTNRLKNLYNSEEAHYKMQNFYKINQISPFYQTKPLIYTIVQLPILILFFNVLLFMPELDGTSFLWIENLAKPDAIIDFDFSVPFLGNAFHLMPCVMILTIWVSQGLSAKHIFWSILIFILLYSFPASVIFYLCTSLAMKKVECQLYDFFK